MAAELEYFGAMVFYGVTVSFCYHMLMYLRAVLRHMPAFVDAEDILFLMAAGFCFFLCAYVKNDGILRWYAFAGAGFGVLAYLRTLGGTLERARKWLLQKLRKKGRIKPKQSRKGQVPADEKNQPENKKEERS